MNGLFADKVLAEQKRTAAVELHRIDQDHSASLKIGTPGTVMLPGVADRAQFRARQLLQ